MIHCPEVCQYPSFLTKHFHRCFIFFLSSAMKTQMPFSKSNTFDLSVNKIIMNKNKKLKEKNEKEMWAEISKKWRFLANYWQNHWLWAIIGIFCSFSQKFLFLFFRLILCFCSLLCYIQKDLLYYFKESNIFIFSYFTWKNETTIKMERLKYRIFFIFDPSFHVLTSFVFKKKKMGKVF